MAYPITDETIADLTMKSEKEESLGYDNMEPKGQDEYAKTQHDLCCQELSLEPRHDRPGYTLLEAVCALKKDRDEWKEEAGLRMGEAKHFREEIEQLNRNRDTIEAKALEIIPGYGNTGKSTFNTPIAVMCRMRDEIDLLRKEFASEQEKAIGWFIEFHALKNAVDETLEENRHLADGDNCTLKKLKDAYAKAKNAGHGLDSEKARAMPPAEFCRKLETALVDAAELLAEIMRDEVNHQDEAEKWLRAYAPHQLFPENDRILATQPAKEDSDSK